jgi:hypothetical protein
VYGLADAAESGTPPQPPALPSDGPSMLDAELNEMCEALLRPATVREPRVP